jgi:cobalamin synthase
MILQWRLFLTALRTAAIVTRMAFTAYVKHELGECSDDCLGATQQLTEVGFYLGALAAWTYI